MKNKNMTDRSGNGTPEKSKIANILRVFVSGKSLNRFEAEHHHDHCLNTTVSTLQNRHGIQLDRERESVSCLSGMANVSVNRYWLNTKPDNAIRARALLNKLESKT